MKRIFLILFFIILFPPRKALAGGPVFTNEYAQVAEAESRAIIIWDGETETILDSLTFNFNPLASDNFVWVLAVPSKPNVQRISDEVFTKFEKLTQKRIDKSVLWQKLLFFDSIEEKSFPSNIFTRPTNIWTEPVVIEPPNQSEKLEQSVRRYGYFIPKEGRPLIRSYTDKNWYFIVVPVNALHVQTNASESLSISTAHTLPLKVSFKTEKPVYPLKLASMRPDIDSESLPVSYDYGIPSEQVLGEKDEKVDEILAVQSKNKHPFLPLDYIHVKVDLFVLAAQKVAISGFITSYANWISTKNIDFTDKDKEKYIDLPTDTLYLTRLFNYIPTAQLDDLAIEYATNNTPVNARRSVFSYSIKLGGGVLFCLGVFFFLRYKYFNKFFDD